MTFKLTSRFKGIKTHLHKRSYDVVIKSDAAWSEYVNERNSKTVYNVKLNGCGGSMAAVQESLYLKHILDDLWHPTEISNSILKGPPELHQILPKTLYNTRRARLWREKFTFYWTRGRMRLIKRVLMWSCDGERLYAVSSNRSYGFSIQSKALFV